MPERPARRAAQPSEGFVAVGFVRGPRGVRGELRIEPLTDFAERFERGARVWLQARDYTVRLSRRHPTIGLLLQIDGIDTREAAAAFSGLYLEVPEDELAELDKDEYYRHEIVGLEVYDSAGTALGRVEQVLETGANDVYIVRDEESELLIPAIDSVVTEIDLASRRMVIEVIQGLERRPLKTPRKRTR